jgi:putative ABC transport system permease protein
LKNSLSPDLWSEHDMPALTFVKLSRGIQPARVNSQILGLAKRHGDPQTKLALWLEPLSDIHFNADIIENQVRTAHSPTLYALMGIALFILILAIINFINLSTAQSVQRAKEVGVRKVLGANRASLVFQFLAETFMLGLFAVVLAVLLVNPVLAAFRSFIPPGISFHFSEPATLVFLLLVTMVTSLLAGLYPARVLAAYLPVVSLKGGAMQKGAEKWHLRKGLIIFQFTVSLVFIIGSIVIASQLSYTRSKDLGFSSDAIVLVGTPRGDSLSKISVLAEKIKQLPGVSKLALQWVSPLEGNGPGHGIKFKSMDEKETDVVQVAGNEDYIPLYQIKLLAGRNLEQADSMKEIVINENLSRLMGCKKPGDAIGKMLYWADKPYPVVGVVADFHSRSFHDPIAPLCIVHRSNREGTLAVKLATTGKESKNIKAVLSNIEKSWKQVYPAATFQYQFYDESMALVYEKDQQTAMLMNTSMAITIFISCMGLFGLAMFSAEKRTKEIGIRKVLGASVTNIAAMLSKDFLELVLIALAIASPIAWYFMNQWLQDFAYRVHISWWVFALAGSGAMLIALITVSFQAIKAALANPVKSLRSE